MSCDNCTAASSEVELPLVLRDLVRKHAGSVYKHVNVLTNRRGDGNKLPGKYSRFSGTFLQTPALKAEAFELDGTARLGCD